MEQAPHDLTQKQQAYALDRTLYQRIRAARPHFTLVDRQVIAPYNGRGFIVKKGQSFRVLLVTGPQIGDVTFWNADDPKERFSALNTWQAEGWIIAPGSRLWSELPRLRPMVTCIEDTVVPSPDGEYHHHFIASHCCPEGGERRFGVPGLNACRLNFLQAIEPFGLGEEYLRENINVHEKDRLDPKTGQRSITRGDGRPGDYIEFYAEMNLIVGVSVCPFGDGSAKPTMYRDGLVRPLAVEIYDTGIEPKPFSKWTNFAGTR
jgi:uncharacterized protein YcgI (DUF1989 family)